MSERATERRPKEQKRNRAKEQRSERATDGQSDGATDGHSNRTKNDRAISQYIKTEKQKRKKSNCVESYGWSERATEQRPTEQKRNKTKEQRSERATDGQSYEATDAQSVIAKND